jgi:hypothetical protein
VKGGLTVIPHLGGHGEIGMGREKEVLRDDGSVLLVHRPVLQSFDAWRLPLRHTGPSRSPSSHPSPHTGHELEVPHPWFVSTAPALVGGHTKPHVVAPVPFFFFLFSLLLGRARPEERSKNVSVYFPLDIDRAMTEAAPLISFRPRSTALLLLLPPPSFTLSCRLPLHGFQTVPENLTSSCPHIRALLVRLKCQPFFFFSLSAPPASLTPGKRIGEGVVLRWTNNGRPFAGRTADGSRYVILGACTGGAAPGGSQRLQATGRRDSKPRGRGKANLFSFQGGARR